MKLAMLGFAAIALVACGSDEESFFQDFDINSPEPLELSSDDGDTESSGSYTGTDRSSAGGATSAAATSSAFTANSSGNSLGGNSSGNTAKSSATTLSSASIANPIVPASRNDLLNKTVGYGVIIDARDSKRYRTVTIDGRTWMAENLNFSDESYNPLLKGNTRCYDNNETYCEVMGRLYNRAAALNDQKCAFGGSCAMGSGNIQGACPAGWHVPSLAEARSLVEFTESTASIRSTLGWAKSIPQGKDTYGLSFAGSGLWDESFTALGEKAYAWVYFADANQYYIELKAAADSITIRTLAARQVYLPLRCVKDMAASSSSIARSSSSYSSSSSRLSSSRASSSSYSSSSAKSSSSINNRTKLNYSATYSIPTKGAQFNPNINYGSMTDPRDGKTYRTVEVDGKTWMAENLDYAGTTIGSTYCFNMDDRFCNIYGRLYDREAAMQDLSCTYKSYCNLGKDTVQGICPDGWHIPLRSEGQRLATIVSGKAAPLEALKGWGNDTLTVTNAKDSLGLSFIGSGDLVDHLGFRSIGAFAFTWVHDEGNTQTYILVRSRDNETIVRSYNDYKMWQSVRCIKNQ